MGSFCKIGSILIENGFTFFAKMGSLFTIGSKYAPRSFVNKKKVGALFTPTFWFYLSLCVHSASQALFFFWVNQ